MRDWLSGGAWPGAHPGPPHLTGVIVEEVVAAAGLLLVTARARASEAACPRCGMVSRRVHSRYSRTLADAAVGDRQAMILLMALRFFCLSLAARAGCSLSRSTA